MEYVLEPIKIVRIIGMRRRKSKAAVAVLMDDILNNGATFSEGERAFGEHRGRT